MMSIKLIHISCALLTVLSFGLRGVWMLVDSPLLKRKPVRILPHVIDTCLFASGIAMAIMLYGAFYTQPWLQAKLLALVLYIVAGSVALKYGRTKTVRIWALLAALGIFIYIVLVARAHSPIPNL